MAIIISMEPGQALVISRGVHLGCIRICALVANMKTAKTWFLVSSYVGGEPSAADSENTSAIRYV